MQLSSALTLPSDLAGNMAAMRGECVQHEAIRKPYKISVKSRQFKGIVASSLAELRSLACSILEIPYEVKVFLEEDLTEVDDEEYFQFLPAQTKFIVLRPGETPSFGVNAANRVVGLERSESFITRTGDCTDGASRLDPKLKQRLVSDPIFYINFTDEELQNVITLDPVAASQELNITREEFLFYQETCEREEIRRSELRDANELLKLFQRTRSFGKNDSPPVLKKSKIG